MTWGAKLGRLDFLRQRGLPWIETLRGWFLVGMAGSATGRFVFDLDRRWAAAILVIIPIALEAAALLLGLWMARAGMIEGHYREATRLDPYRREQLDLQRRTLVVLEEVRAMLHSRS